MLFTWKKERGKKKERKKENNGVWILCFKYLCRPFLKIKNKNKKSLYPPTFTQPIGLVLFSNKSATHLSARHVYFCFLCVSITWFVAFVCFIKVSLVTYFFILLLIAFIQYYFETVSNSPITFLFSSCLALFS